MKINLDSKGLRLILVRDDSNILSDIKKQKKQQKTKKKQSGNHMPRFDKLDTTPCLSDGICYLLREFI